MYFVQRVKKYYRLEGADSAAGTRKVEGAALADAYFGDRHLLRVAFDVRRAEGRIHFNSVAVASESGERTRVELEPAVLVLTGVRSFATSPVTARPETIVLKWEFTPTSDGVLGAFLLIGDPEPVPLRFECARFHLEEG